MPLTRITLRAGYDDEWIARLSALFQQTLVDEFAVPPADKFQFIDVLPAARCIVDPHYLSGGRSEDYLLFHIFAGKPRSAQQKKRFYRRLCDRLQAELGVAPDDVMVVIQFNHAEDWSFSRGEMLTG
ncbi:tautomerase family protein [Klebsiella sp. WOUb02]|uniref:tautomerase family protein n=1 Tax=Klebsiella sp. WOUb02 TaxID=3161071 RepID=UPI003CF10054